MSDFARVDYEYGVWDGDYLVRRFKTLEEAKWFADSKFLKVKKFNFIDWNIYQKRISILIRNFNIELVFFN